ncbi:hypothetical protein LJC45_04950 [Alistipes sp. OttesenSCG-928-B03]|nr:hypothetical protein [Alistipes sp. OttesenSCG-928-B03]
MKKEYYEVNVDMKWSQDYRIKAKSASEAKKKAWERFRKRPPRKLFELLADKSWRQ